MLCKFNLAGMMTVCHRDFCQSTSLACFVDEYSQASTLHMTPTCTADLLFIMRVELFAEDGMWNLADFSSTSRWT